MAIGSMGHALTKDQPSRVVVTSLQPLYPAVGISYLSMTVLQNYLEIKNHLTNKLKFDIP